MLIAPGLDPVQGIAPYLRVKGSRKKKALGTVLVQPHHAKDIGVPLLSISAMPYFSAQFAPIWGREINRTHLS